MGKSRRAKKLGLAGRHLRLLCRVRRGNVHLQLSIDDSRPL